MCLSGLNKSCLLYVKRGERKKERQTNEEKERESVMKGGKRREGGGYSTMCACEKYVVAVQSACKQSVVGLSPS